MFAVITDCLEDGATQKSVAAFAWCVARGTLCRMDFNGIIFWLWHIVYIMELVNYCKHFVGFLIFLDYFVCKEQRMHFRFLLSCQRELSSMQLYPIGFAQQSSI